MDLLGKDHDAPVVAWKKQLEEIVFKTKVYKLIFFCECVEVRTMNLILCLVSHSLLIMLCCRNLFQVTYLAVIADPNLKEKKLEIS